MTKPTVARIVYRDCPRCGKPVAGTNRPIHGSDALHARYAGICSPCTTADEKQEILAGIGESIIGKVRS